MSRYQAEVFGSLADQQLRTIGAIRGKSQQILRDGTDGDWLTLSKIASKLEDCCRTPYLAFNETTSDISIQEMRCRSRLCPRCGRTRSFDLIERLKPIVDQMDSPRFLTFTIAATNDPLKERLKHIVESFAKLRRSKTWKKYFTIGFYTIEVTHNRKTDRWHPHIHVIVDGKYIKQKTLSDQWLSITKDSFVVDIRIVKSKKDAIGYVVKYVTKTQDSSNIPDHRIPDWALAIKNARMVSTFGGARMPKDKEKEDRTCTDVSPIAPIHQLGKAADSGDEIARDLWEQILHQARKGKIDFSSPSADLRQQICRSLIDRFKNWMDPPQIRDPDPPPEQTAQASMWDRRSALGSD